MNETQLRNLSDEELLRVVDNMVPTNILAVELARRLAALLDANGECPYCCGGDD